MTNIYYYRLDDECKRLYLDKLEYNEILLPDPLDTNMRLHLYKPLSQNIIPDLTFGDIYIYLVETAQVYSREEFKNFKTLPCYKEALNGKVRDILAYKCTNTEMCVLTCDVEGVEDIAKLYRSWVVVALNGVIQSGHCTCMNEFKSGCRHIAALLLSLEITIKKIIQQKTSEDSSFEKSTEKKTWSDFTEFLDSKSSEKKNSSAKENSSMNMTLSTDYKERLKVIKKIVPNAPIFTLLCDSDISSSDEDEFEDEESIQVITY